MKTYLTENQFDSNPFYTTPITDTSNLLSVDCVKMFDQNGYHLTAAEQLYADVNGYSIVRRRHETVIRTPWLIDDSPNSSAHFNHCDLFERKGYSGEAKLQLIDCAQKNPLLWKLIKMKPKWGIDASIDYVDEEGNVFEIFHYEWDSFEYNPIAEKKKEIENFILSNDWNLIALDLLSKKNMWYNLDFFEQSLWKTNYFGLSPEKFKNVIWCD